VEDQLKINMDDPERCVVRPDIYRIVWTRRIRIPMTADDDGPFEAKRQAREVPPLPQIQRVNEKSPPVNEPQPRKLNVTQELRKIMAVECEDPAARLQQLGYVLYLMGTTLETDSAVDVRTVLSRSLEIE
jgi:hypothetical protein